MAREEFTTTLQRLRPKSAKRSVSKVALLVLVVLGIGLVIFDLVNTGSKQVLVSTLQILPGDKIDQTNATLVSIDLQGQSDLYLSVLKPNRVSRYAISPGELIPKSMVTDESAAQLTTLVLQLQRPMSASVRIGDKVDVYCTKLLAAGSVGEPELTVIGAFVRSISASSALGQNTQNVELSFSPQFLPGLLTAVSREDDIALVNTPIVG
ncbi:MAG: hypothetical protein EBY26_00050 [Microbacteriaceae bacterium]|nr:hypothetical protein [Microbacteriaceae bacterium]